MSESMHGGRRPDDTMTAAQQVALAAVKRGRDVEDAAAEAGVSRMTVYRWIKADPVFRAAYNAWEEAARQSARARLVTVLDKALHKVMCCVESDSRLAFKVVAAMGAFAAGGALQTDPDRVRQEMELEEREQDHQIKRRMKRLGRVRLFRRLRQARLRPRAWISRRLRRRPPPFPPRINPPARLPRAWGQARNNVTKTGM